MAGGVMTAKTAVFPLAGRSVWVAGHRGMIGSALHRILANEGCKLLTEEPETLDLTVQRETWDWMDLRRPEVVFLLAGKVASVGMVDRTSAQMMYGNLAIQNNVIHGAWRAATKRLIFVASSAVYPNIADRPISEDMLLKGPPDEASQWYALAKISGIKLCQAYSNEHGCDFLSVIPTNAYGPGDNFTPENARVVAALIGKFHAAKMSRLGEVDVGGTGRPLREFIFVDDLAQALIHVAQHARQPLLNIGSGIEVSIRELAETISEVVGFTGTLKFSTNAPGGAPRKLLDAGQLAKLGWKAKTGLREGLEKTYDWFLEHRA